MTRYALLILAALVGSCAQFTDAVNVDVRENDLTEETESIMPIRCSPIPVSLSPSSSVHNLTFVDISSVYVLGTPLSYRDEASRVVNRVTEMLSMFNPDVITQHVDQTSVQPRSLLEEAEELSLSLSHQVTDWKLVLLFVQANSTCACSPHVAADVTAVVQDVEAALQLLQKRLPRTLVHVVVWSTIQQDKCECMRDESINQRLYKATLLKRLQDSLSRVLENPKWHSDRVDFTAMLQSAPVILEPDSDSESDSENTRSDLNQIAVQLWTNLLQPSTGQAEVMDTSVITIPCPTQKRSFLRMQNSPSESQGRGLSRASTRTDPVMGTVIPCTDHSPSPTTPTSVHELRPGDIKVVAAVGDSLTAANGVGAPWNNLLLVVREYRGLSWSIGGDKNIADVTTLPNILREFNPSLTGFSTGTGNQDSPGAFLNQAVSGAKSGDMVRQVHVLVDKMKANSGIDFHNDWKVITMFIGGNDMCDFCKDSVFYSPGNVIGRIRQALDILHSEVPRAIVNLVELLDMVPLRDLHNDKTLSCPTWLVRSVCRCILKPNEGSPDLQKVIDLNKAYQRAMRELIDSGRYDTHHHFTVVLQPFLREVILPRLEDGRPDRSYFSPDCFHLSQKAHTLMAQALWNNMLEPVGSKTFRQDFSAGIDLKCPSEEHPYIFTNVNSLPDSTTTPAPTIASVNSDYTFPGPPPTSAPATEDPYIFTNVNSLPDSTTTPAPTIASVNSDYTFPGPPPTSAPATEHPYIFTNVNSLPDSTTTPAPTIASVNSDYTFPGPPPTSAPATEHPYIFTNVNSLPDSTTTPAPTIASVNSDYTFPGPPPTSAPATNWGSDFSCVNTTPSNSVPTSVHRLRPADIKVVAALGDSLTAGFGAKAKNHLQLRTEYRGVSWSIGGDKTLETVTTLPNILKKFNPKIKGASKGQGEWQTGFNMAVSGAKISGIPEQVRRLIDTMKNTTTVDFENDWKLVTLFIGGNDLCQYCNDRASMSPQNYSRHMMTSLDMLYNEVPRTIVNVLEILEIEGLRRIKRDSLGCSLLQKFICPCFLLPGEDSPELAEVKRINRELQVATEKLVYGGRYDEREDFAVVVQSFFRNSIVPLNADGRPDTTYFSVDCFHFSERGHAYMAAALWSNMLEPVGKKQTYTNFTNTRSNIKCPTEEHPYIFTKVNSLPDSTTTTAPTTHKTTSQPQSSDCNVDVPVWLAAVLAVIGLLIGSAVTWLLLSRRAKRSKQMMTAAVELKGTVF